MSGKLRILEASIEQITREIEEREQLRDTTLETIDKAICEQKTMLHQVAPHGIMPITVGEPKRRASIEKEVASLEEEKRRETVSAWRDIAGLKRELRELQREHAEEARRHQVIGT